jgi:predicted SnoaL-like aldol condensation-catalyzing enzyme
MDNEALVRRAIEAIWNRGELVVADELFGPDYIKHDGLIPDLVLGPEAIKISVAMYRIAFPDLHISVEEISTDGEIVVTHWTARRDTPHPATGGRMSDQTLLTGVTLCLVSGGKIVESWMQWDGTQTLIPVRGQPGFLSFTRWKS